MNTSNITNIFDIFHSLFKNIRYREAGQVITSN